jgi:uncharacterized membrane protein YqjE
MTSQLDTDHQHGISELVTGVVDDAQEVIKQQLNLFKAELVNKAKDTAFAAVPLMAGICCVFISIICLAFAVAYGLASSGVPLWGSFAIVSGVLLIAAAALALWSKTLFKPIDPSIPETVEGLKENIQWKTTTTTKK